MIEVIKAAAVEAVNQTQPCNICFGTVTQLAPLAIEINERQVLPEGLLVLTRQVTEHRIAVTPEGGPRGVYTLHMGLSVGEKVLLIRMGGGGRYVVIDRLEAIP